MTARRLWPLLVAAWVVVAGCGGDTEDTASDAAAAADGTLSVDTRDAQTADAAADSAPDMAVQPPDVALDGSADIPASLAPLGETPLITEVAPKDEPRDIQPAVAVAPDGTIGVAYAHGLTANAPGVRFAVVASDGGTTSDVALDSDLRGGRNEPALCARGAAGGWVAVWSQDTKEADSPEPNLRVRFRLIDAAGQPSGLGDTRVITAIEGNHWLGDVACADDGSFAIAGVRPDPDGTFGVFAQRYDVVGAPSGAAVTLNPNPTGDQLHPVIAPLRSGRAMVAWDDSLPGGGGDLVRVLGRAVAIPDDGTQAPSAVVLSGSAGQPALGVSLATDPRTGDYLAAATVAGARLELVAGNVFEPAPEAPVAADPGDIGHGASLALAGADADGVRFVVSWLRGTGANVAVRAGLVADGRLVEGPVTVAQGKLPPYRTGVGHGAGITALAWTEAPASGQFRIRLAIWR